MDDQSRQKYIKGLKAYHKRLELLVKQSFKIDTKYLEILSWGYHTTAFYIKSGDNKEYLLKLVDWSEKKEADIAKDIDFSNLFRPVIPTPTYIKNTLDRYTNRFEDKILRLSHYISGLAPLNMNFDILGQMVDVLKKIHATPYTLAHTGYVRPMPTRSLQAHRKKRFADFFLWACSLTHLSKWVIRCVPPALTHATAPNVLLHGDLTPHNVLVSYGKIVAVMDFEMSFVGPREYDLARMSLFSWNYMANTPFEDVARFVLEKYAQKNTNTDLFFQLAMENAKKHLDSINNHCADYDRREDWEKDYNFAKKQLALFASDREL